MCNRSANQCAQRSVAQRDYRLKSPRRLDTTMDGLNQKDKHEAGAVNRSETIADADMLPGEIDRLDAVQSRPAAHLQVPFKLRFWHAPI